MTLIELVVVVGILGLIITVIAAAITVTMRQAPEANERVTLARWEQNLGTWLPGDLASATWPVDTEEDPDSPDNPDEAIDNPDYEPCTSAICTWGVNILHLTWYEDGDQVDVSYRYGEGSDGVYEFRRVECRGGSCDSITLVGEMAPPGAGGTPPISVTFPPSVTETDPNGSEVEYTSGRRVGVTVLDGDGQATLTFTGGGAELVDLEPAAIQPPQFLQARSGCGGPITLIVDESQSLNNTAVGHIQTGVRSFVSEFAGTPTFLQIVGMGNRSARVLGPSPNGWNNWYDLSDGNVVNGLIAAGSPIDTIDNNGYTNWEDAFYRAYYAQNGFTYQYNGNPAFPASELIVFFTDGLPTYDRGPSDGRGNSGPSQPAAPTPLPTAFDGDANLGSFGSGNPFSPQGWYRARWLMQQNPTTRVIGVGVGPAFLQSTDLYDDTNLSNSEIAAWAAPNSGSSTKNIPAELLLGDLIAGNLPSTWPGGSLAGRYTKVAYSGGWGDVSEADILTTGNFSQFGSALEQIALAECGGTLTVQTRLQDSGQPATESVTYEVTGVDHPLTESTTSAVSKTAVFDIATESATEATILLKPRALDTAGYSAEEWQCRSRNVVINDPDKVSVVDSNDLAAGVNVTVAANEAISCALLVDET